MQSQVDRFHRLSDGGNSGFGNRFGQSRECYNGAIVVRVQFVAEQNYVGDFCRRPRDLLDFRAVSTLRKIRDTLD